MAASCERPRCSAALVVGLALTACAPSRAEYQVCYVQDGIRCTADAMIDCLRPRELDRALGRVEEALVSVMAFCDVPPSSQAMIGEPVALANPLGENLNPQNPLDAVVVVE